MAVADAHRLPAVPAQRRPVTEMVVIDPVMVRLTTYFHLQRRRFARLSGEVAVIDPVSQPEEMHEEFVSAADHRAFRQPAFAARDGDPVLHSSSFLQLEPAHY